MLPPVPHTIGYTRPQRRRRLPWHHYVPLALLTLLVLLVSLAFAYGMLMRRNDPKFWDL